VMVHYAYSMANRSRVICQEGNSPSSRWKIGVTFNFYCECSPTVFIFYMLFDVTILLRTNFLLLTYIIRLALLAVTLISWKIEGDSFGAISLKSNAVGVFLGVSGRWR